MRAKYKTFSPEGVYKPLKSKGSVSDTYALKYIRFIRNSKSDQELIEIIDKIYENGFEDGING